MRDQVVDVYAFTNPAFWSLGVAAFVSAYQEAGLAAKPYTREALLFALVHDLLACGDGWHYSRSIGRGWKKPDWPVRSDVRGGVLQACGRLGAWCGPLDLPTVFIALGVRP